LALTAFTFFYGILLALYSSVYLVELALPLLLLLLLVIWALPNVRSGPVGALRWLFFAFLIGITVWPDYIALDVSWLPWITVRRLISAPLAVILLICLSVSKQFRDEVINVLKVEPLVTRLFIGFVALQIISIAFSDDKGVSFDKFLTAQFSWTAIFIAGCYVFRKPGSVAKWSAILCLTLVPIFIAGLFEWRASQLPWAGHIPSFLAVGDESVQRTLQGSTRAATGEYRVKTIHSTPLGFAEYLALTTPFLVHYVVGSFSFQVRFVALAALSVTLAMIVFTDSRFGLAGFLLAIILYVGVYAGFRWRHSKGSIFSPAIVLSYPLIFSAFVASTFLVRRMELLVWGGGATKASTEARETQMTEGLQLLFKNPFGTGIGRGAEALGFRSPTGILTIDTYYILIALEYGVIGFFVYYTMFVWAGSKAYLRLFFGGPLDGEGKYLIPISIALTNFLVIKSVFSQEANHPIAFMLLAMIMALLARPSPSSQDDSEEASVSAAKRDLNR
jgi:hypothetical protein